MRCLIYVVILLEYTIYTFKVWCAVKQTTVCFHDNDAAERGATLAMYDYADYLERLYPHEFSVKIMLPIGTKNSRFVNRFTSRFKHVAFYHPEGGRRSGTQALPRHALDVGCQILYIIKAGNVKSLPVYPDSFYCKTPTAVHAVFHFEKHGFTYATINKAMLGSISAEADSWKSDLVVPHIVRPPDPAIVKAAVSLRTSLNISQKAIVICRSGGKNTFSIDFAKTAVKTLADRFPAGSLRFIFLNTDDSFIRREYKRYSHKIHFMKATIDDRQKESFFSTCDAFLHARKDGETFGLAIAEFSVRNKPVITYGGIKNPVNRHHLDVLNDTAFVYNDSSSLEKIIASFVEKGIPREKRYDAYKEFSPEKVMDKFVSVFLRPILDRTKRRSYHEITLC